MSSLIPILSDNKPLESDELITTSKVGSRTLTFTIARDVKAAFIQVLN